MLNVKIISTGTLKEDYLRQAVAEYAKRLSGYCKFSEVVLKEAKLPDSPSDREIASALDAEAKNILAEISPRSFKIAMCVEGKQLSSEELAEKLESISSEAGTICFIIGGSYGLSSAVKASGNLKLSFSRLTFPHQLMRVILLEAVYRGFNIIKGTKYHK